MKQRMLAQVIEEFGKEKDVQAHPSILKHLKTALSLYVIPKLVSQQDLQKGKLKSSDPFEINITKLDLPCFLITFDEEFDEAVQAEKTSKFTKGNYRSALGRFLKWIKEQVWYKEYFGTSVPTYAPKHVGAWRNKPPERSRQEIDYGLKDKDLPEGVRKELIALEKFWVKYNKDEIQPTEQFNEVNESKLIEQTPEQRRHDREERSKKFIQGEGEKIKPNMIQVEPSTTRRYIKVVKLFFGWCVNIEGYSQNELNLDLFIDIVFLKDYADWLIKQRGCTHSSSSKLFQAAISVAKWKTYDQSHQRDWSDIPLIKDLQSLRADKIQSYKQDKPELDELKWENKLITHEQARKVVQYLYEQCAELANNGRPRHPSSVVSDWQSYLMVKILVYSPVRQEELRNLIYGSTLIKIVDSQGTERYAVKLKKHKNFNKTRKTRYYPLPSVLTKDLDIWLNVIRPRAIDAPCVLESWLHFWGKKTDSLEKLRKTSELAKRGEINEKILEKEKYLANLDERIKGLEVRIAGWEKAKENAEKCHYTFFSLGGNRPESFCRHFDETNLHCVSSLISYAVARGTKALFGEPRFLNPHGFRNIGSKQLRLSGNGSKKEAFSALAGHSVTIDDEYAAQITGDYELIEDIVDDWWTT